MKKIILLMLSTLIISNILVAQQCCDSDKKFNIYGKIFCALTKNEISTAIKIYQDMRKGQKKKLKDKYPLTDNLVEANIAINNTERTESHLKKAQNVLNSYIKSEASNQSKKVYKDNKVEYAFLIDNCKLTDNCKRLVCSQKIIDKVRNNFKTFENNEKEKVEKAQNDKKIKDLEKKRKRLKKENADKDRKIEQLGKEKKYDNNKIKQLERENERLEREKPKREPTMPTTIQQTVIEQAVFDDKSLKILSNYLTKNPHKTLIGTRAIYFELNSYELSYNSKKILDQLLHPLKNCKDCQLLLEGFTDDIGHSDYNFKLSEKRVKAVEYYLTKNGFYGIYIDKKHYGEIGNNEDNARKVDVHIFQ